MDTSAQNTSRKENSANQSQKKYILPGSDTRPDFLNQKRESLSTTQKEVVQKNDLLQQIHTYAEDVTVAHGITPSKKDIPTHTTKSVPAPQPRVGEKPKETEDDGVATIPDIEESKIGTQSLQDAIAPDLAELTKDDPTTLPKKPTEAPIKNKTKTPEPKKENPQPLPIKKTPPQPIREIVPPVQKKAPLPAYGDTLESIQQTRYVRNDIISRAPQKSSALEKTSIPHIRTYDDDVARAQGQQVPERTRPGTGTPQENQSAQSVIDNTLSNELSREALKDDENKTWRQSHVPKEKIAEREMRRQFKSQPQKRSGLPGNETPLRTLDRDLSSVMRNNNTSKTDIALQERKKREAQGGLAQPIYTKQKKPRRGGLIVRISVVFLLLIVGSGSVWISWIYYTQSKEAHVTDGPTIQTQALFFVENEKQITDVNIKGNSLGIVIADNIPKDETITHVFITTSGETVERLITTRQLFEKIKTQIPVPFLRSLQDTFMLGIYGAPQPSPFIILQSDTFGNAFNGMLSWEETLPYDIESFFGTLALSGLNYTSLGTPFVDTILDNTDVRVVQDAQGNTILLYGIVNGNRIIITTTEEAYKEIRARLRTQ